MRAGILLAALLISVSFTQSVYAWPNEKSIWAEVSQKYDISPYLLYAISFMESRRTWEDGMARPWPWTLNISGKGHFYKTREEAVEALDASLKKGVRNIDVGMMQINIIHNGHNVEAPHDLLDTKMNIDVGAKILKAAIDSSNDLELAVGHYFNSDEELARKYGNRVIEMVGRLVIELNR